VNILVVKPSSLGDILHTFPRWRWRGRAFPGFTFLVVNAGLAEAVRLYRGWTGF